MKFKQLYTSLCVGLCSLITPFFWAFAEAKDFIVVIDPGHGGHDPGAIGKRGKEKDINLQVALKVGKLIETNCKEVKVIYTRKKDVFVTLDGRAAVANKAKADLFISVHTNSVAKGRTIQGAETYTLGLHRTAENLEVAKRENSVILIENDYQQRYAGFNPNSAESYIIFEFVQDKDMKKSVRLATLIQHQFRHSARRIDKGVHQAGFLVLRETYMPSVLVELGYISTPAEEDYLLSEAGTSAMAHSIYKAFVNYKCEHDAEAAPETVAEKQNVRPVNTKPTPSSRQSASSDTAKPVFKIQFYASSTKLSPKDAKFKGLSPVNCYREDGLYKYTYGENTDYNKVYKTYKQVRVKFKDSFIIAFRNDEKMDVHEAMNEFKKNRK